MAYTLKYECTAIDVNRPYVDMGRPGTVFSSRVRAMPNSPVRNFVPLKPPHGVQTTPAGKFSVITYNMLADLYAKVCSSSACLVRVIACPASAASSCEASMNAPANVRQHGHPCCICRLGLGCS